VTVRVTGSAVVADELTGRADDEADDGGGDVTRLVDGGGRPVVKDGPAGPVGDGRGVAAGPFPDDPHDVNSTAATTPIRNLT
jgi:hypothetical protein